MPLEFSQPVDIVNHGLQLLGVDAITATSFQTPDGKAAREMSRCYDKLRAAELQRATWRFATRRVVLRPIDPATCLWTPPAYSAVATYTVGQVTVYNGDWYQAQPGVQVGDIPNIAATWFRYFGPQTLDPYITAEGSSYFAGELVIVPEAWAVGNTYAINTLIERTNLFYISQVAGNIGHDPATDGTNWTPYIAGGNAPNGLPVNSGPFTYSAFAGGPSVYLSLLSTPQTTDVSLPPPVAGWLSVGGSLTALQVLYPLGTGPAVDNMTANIFYLPSGYLRKLPVNPRGILSPPVGGPTFNIEEDDLLEGNFVVSGCPGPALMRFVANVIDVQNMSPMFCRGLGASCALQTCEALTQAADKKADARAEYKSAMGDARTVNAIEVGTVDSVEDELITVRL